VTGIDHHTRGKLALEGELVWRSVAKDGFTGDLRVTNARIDVTADPIEGAPARDLHWRTGDRELEPLVGRRIPVTVTELGELTAEPSDAIREPAQLAQPDVVLRQAFVRVPAQALSLGARWDGGPSRMPVTAGTISFQPQLEVAKISGNGNTVLITAHPDLAVDLGKTMTLERQSTDVWIAFDRTLGDITSSGRAFSLRFAVTAGGKRGMLDLEIATTYASTRKRTEATP
jgi:hypothetical protein